MRPVKIQLFGEVATIENLKVSSTSASFKIYIETFVEPATFEGPSVGNPDLALAASVVQATPGAKIIEQPSQEETEQEFENDRVY